MLRHILTIWAKEQLDTLRDRRTLAVMILAPVLMMPLFTLLPQFLLGGQVQEARSGALGIDVHGVANGPQLVEYLQQQGAEIREISGDPAAYVQEDRTRVVVVIGAGFQACMEAEQPAPVSLVLDASNMKSGALADRLLALLNGFNQQVAAERLRSRGLDPGMVTPVQIATVNIATEQQMGGAFLGMFIPMFLVLFAFLGGMYAAIDVTAGEKERGTLEPLLSLPVGRAELVLGKLLAVFTTSYAAVVLSLLSTYAAFQVVPGSLYGGNISFALPLAKIAWLLVVALPLTLMLNGVEMIVCMSARSFKEAQNYVTPLQLVLMLPALVVGFLPGFKPASWFYAIPAMGQILLFRDILGGTAVAGGAWGVGIASCVGWAAVAIAAAIAAFQREKVLFRT